MVLLVLYRGRLQIAPPESDWGCWCCIQSNLQLLSTGLEHWAAIFAGNGRS